jgi:flagellum-specific ATP synthase
MSHADASVIARNAVEAIAAFSERMRATSLARIYGRVTEIGGASIRIEGLSAAVKTGDFVRIGQLPNQILAQIIGIDGHGVLATPSGSADVISLGERATPQGSICVYPDAKWKGRILNAMAEPTDGGGDLPVGEIGVSLDNPPPRAMARGGIGARITTGVKAVDVFTPLCLGQRIGIFAGSGVGKSTLLAMLAKAPDFDCVVVALVGERGREVREFVFDTLGRDRAKAVLVAATSDEPPVMRKMAARTATAIAEYFRDRGERVLLIMDSVTRYAQACREIALAAGEPPVARGFPPSVFRDLPFLLERAGPGSSGQGSISAIYTVLVDGDDHNDPVADNVRGTLDGHIVLDRAIAAQGRYPAIDILGSVSRLAPKAWSQAEALCVMKWKQLLLRYEESRDLRALGGYVRGMDQELDMAISTAPRLYAQLEQSPKNGFCANAFQALAQSLQGSNDALGRD